MPETLETDYLVIGAGAVGMSFVDTLLTESDADIVMVDRRHAPGGHWVDAYPFVRLHQPSAFYGVSSTPLGADRIDETGSNAGYFELASGTEVAAYFDRVMRERFLPSGRVRYFPMHDARETEARSADIAPLLGGDGARVTARRRIVDSTFFDTAIPATHDRKFHVADGVACVPPNDLPRRAPNHSDFVILGAGKTAMDVGVWLIENGADPDKITWVRPRDSWLINRETTQPGPRFFHQSIGGMARQMEAIKSSTSVDDLFDRLEAAELMLRIDPAIRPEMFHFATISAGEVALLRRIEHVVRGARVARVEPGKMTLSNDETIDIAANALYVDCTANAVAKRPPQPVFEDGRITLQMTRLPNPTFSAALAAYVETHYEGDDEKNRLCTPVALPDAPEDWPAATLGNMTNQLAWSQDKALRAWMTDCRLDGFGRTARDADRSDPAVADVLARIKESAMPAGMNLQKLIAAAT
ncbi:MAG: NAD(P)/FAD-dependent oxidoreductase [Pseudomonadota bacterium]